MQMTIDQVIFTMPNARRQVGVFIPVLDGAMTNRKIDTPKR